MDEWWMDKKMMMENDDGKYLQKNRHMDVWSANEQMDELS